MGNKCCPYFELTSTGGAQASQKIMLGFFALQDNKINDRALYRNRNGQYLYQHQNGKWLVKDIFTCFSNGGVLYILRALFTIVHLKQIIGSHRKLSRVCCKLSVNVKYKCVQEIHGNTMMKIGRVNDVV